MSIQHQHIPGDDDDHDEGGAFIDRDDMGHEAIQMTRIKKNNKQRLSDTSDEVPLMVDPPGTNFNQSGNNNSQHQTQPRGFFRKAPPKPRQFPLNDPNGVHRKNSNTSSTCTSCLLLYPNSYHRSKQASYLFTYVGPLVFVLLVTMGKEWHDDYLRRKRDNEANSQKYEILTQEGPKQVPSSKIRVGDLVVIQKDQRVPADMILLRTTESSGACFIRTDQLDGETDWKLRIAVPFTQKLPSDDDVCQIRGSLYADPPHKDIYSFIGSLRIDSTLQHPDIDIPLGVENTLWSNTTLASGTAVGIVVYTGPDTRAIMNTSHPKTKVGILDSEVNRLSKILFLVTLILSFVMVALDGFKGKWYINLFRFLILFSSIIPISLRVNLDMGKTFYSAQIERDKEIPETIVRNSMIPEELGRIEYLLSDKTGTLTCNEMELKKIHTGTLSYTDDTMDEVTNRLRQHFQLIRSFQENAGSSQSSTNPFIRYGKSRHGETASIYDLVESLALCHNVTPTEDTQGGIQDEVSYQASSPDEIAIVKWTEKVGITLFKRDLGFIQLRLDAGVSREGEMPQIRDYEILYIFPFTSESKRMGIIVSNKESGEITFIQKGADTVMANIVQYNDWLDEECDNMAREGLRTLVVGRKRLSSDSFNRFKDDYEKARRLVVDRDHNMNLVVERHLEHDLELLGVTGVEDRLQEGVRTTLELLRNAGLKIWMLTGDKVETATCVAVSSKLVSRDQHIHTVAKLQGAHEVNNEIELLRRQLDCCLVIDGGSLQLCLDHFRQEFIEVATKLSAVVCCRCSPTQKAEITQLIREYTKKRTVAMGDGGNDVSMIQAANVGVGLVGKEGKQASLAADFSITQFHHVSRLLLWHGRNSYKRSAKLSQFVIHRGLIISIMQAVFSALFYFAPIALFQGMLLVGYTTVYTMAPVFSLVLDHDITEEIAMLYPELYRELTKGRSLSYKTFFTWLLISVYQGGALMMLAVWLFATEFVHIVSISFTALVLNELLMVALEIRTWHKAMVWSELGSLFIYFISMWMLPTYFDLSFILSWTFIWKVAVLTGISSIPLYIIKILSRIYAPPSYAKLT
ncbi:putative aminophospholipid-translocase [Mycoemilia scoparia]|uniref:Phospholipid-transporting ATPase n=1 Tax=Mycoemilia scoparia TaxID=417184 RepID=A0A9W8DSL6_9FUNG|nr:putative aminophospholipid-translocase [Mycoemilia scoparia]